jgi:DNA-nicking Smr family endonuclease
LHSKVKEIQKETGESLIKYFNNNQNIENIQSSIDLHGTNQQQCFEILNQVLTKLQGKQDE